MICFSLRRGVIAIGGIFTVLSEVDGKSVGLGLASRATPVGTKVLSAVLYIYITYLCINMQFL
jgi:hypothetical protein